MVDNPRVFVILIAALILSITLAVFQSSNQDDISLSIKTEAVEQGTTTPKEAPSAPKPAASAPKPKTPIASPGTVTPQTKTNYTIIYTDAGFAPQVIKIKAGQSIRFQNNSNQGMRISSAYQGNLPSYPSLDQGTTVGNGGYYDFTFNDRLTILYFNMNNRSKTGVITVE